MDIRDALFSEIYSLAVKDNKVMLLTADHTSRVVKDFNRDIPRQFYNVGIAEQNMINIAAGMALSGLKVFCFAIAAFLVQRAYEQIKVNICDMSLPVTLIGMGGGDYYALDGESHCVVDESLVKTLPNMLSAIVTNEQQACDAIKFGYEQAKPYYISVRPTRPLRYMPEDCPPPAEYRLLWEGACP